MSSSVIKVENLGKRYLIGSQKQEKYVVLRDVLANSFKFKNKSEAKKNEDFWAVNDVSFNIRQGERVGIIGRNGAGKSTLLKLLSRITEPTRGRITLRGKVASLLEVGTGFHPELTGRENIYLNGAILGMRRNEIKKKFDEIVAFSEVEQFLDTPVKRYSSGMYVRLAFSVAAHLEPEILIVDEVLAVGDAQFQKKCLGKMDEVGRNGRTVLFVSHNMAAIRQLCSRCILLDKGKVLSDGATDATLQRYNQLARDIQIDDKTGLGDERFRRGNGVIRFTSIDITNANGETCTSFKMGEKILFKMAYKVFNEMNGLKVYIALKSSLTGDTVTSVEHAIHFDKVHPGVTENIIVEISANTILRPGEYPLYFNLGDIEGNSASEDVVDDLTLPLVIQNESIFVLDNFNIERSFGFFSLPSKLSMHN